jgi:DNA (cytosine-5)-methyltransferase 1
VIRYLSICSGIEAFSVATQGLGFAPAAFSEIDKFASAVLAQRFGSNMPDEPLSGNAPPNIGDFTRLLDDVDLRTRLGHVDLLVGGTPCQAFSFAGKRLSLADARGNLTLAFAVLAHELARSHGCRNALWENVPGVLSTPDNAFGCFLGALVGADAPLDLPAGIGRWPDEGMVEGPGARAAWRLLDAQYFGLAQRRERVFVVVDLGGGQIPRRYYLSPKACAGILRRAEKRGKSLPPQLRAALEAVAATATTTCPSSEKPMGGGNRSGAIDVAATLTAKGQRIDFEVETFIAEVAGTLPAGANSTGGERQPGMGAETAATYLIAHTLRGEGFDASEDGTGRGIPLVPVALRGLSDYGDGLPCLRAEGGDAGCGTEALIAFSSKDTSVNASIGIAPTLQASAGRGHGAGLAIAFDPRQSDVLVSGDLTGPLDTGVPGPAIAFSCKDHGADAADDVAPTLRAMGHGESHPNAGGQVAIAHGWAVRRLIVDECARLQGFPDGWTRIPWRGKPAELCPDGPQYKCYGNSMAVTVMRWLAERIQFFSAERAA